MTADRLVPRRAVTADRPALRRAVTADRTALRRAVTADRTVPRRAVTADRPVLRRTLAGMGAVMGANAFAGAWYALAGAKDWPVEWLRGTPFRDYRVPGAILGAVVGGSQALASAALWRGHRHARRAALAAAAILLGWIVTQLAIIGYVSPLQPIVLVWALVSGALATRLAG